MGASSDDFTVNMHGQLRKAGKVEAAFAQGEHHCRVRFGHARQGPFHELLSDYRVIRLTGIHPGILTEIGGATNGQHLKADIPGRLFFELPSQQFGAKSLHATRSALRRVM